MLTKEKTSQKEWENYLFAHPHAKINNLRLRVGTPGKNSGKRLHEEALAHQKNLSLLPNLTLTPTNAQTSNVSMGKDYGVKARIIFD